MGQVVCGKLKMGGKVRVIPLLGYPEDPNTPPYVRESYQIDTPGLGRRGARIYSGERTECLGILENPTTLSFHFILFLKKLQSTQTHRTVRARKVLGLILRVRHSPYGQDGKLK
jgi:hypothetical protein